VADTRADLPKWMFGFWIATLVPLAGVMAGMVTILRRNAGARYKVQGARGGSAECGVQGRET
jgi:hypothetical protein